MARHLPPWPSHPPTQGSVVLRPFTDSDAHLAFELAEDPYIPLIGSLPAEPDDQQSRQWVQRMRGRYQEGTGFAFAVADAVTGTAVGTIGLWLADLPHGRAAAGYSMSPHQRGRGSAGSALRALTDFAWTIPTIHRVELRIEPWNNASIGVAERAGYHREGLMRRYQEIGGTRRDMLLYAITR